MPSQAERRAAMRARLIDASRLLFARDGYDATSTNALLRAADASKGALYHHFPSKQALCAAWLRDEATRSRDKQRELLDSKQSLPKWA